MMKTAVPRGLMVAGALLGAAAALLAAQVKPASPGAARFGRYTIEAKHLEGTMTGPWEFSNDVTVTGPEVTVTCDRLQIWPPSKAGVDFERAEASGHVVVRARYLASDRTEWTVVGTAAFGSYDRKAGQGVLRGSVRFDGTNLTTGAVLSVAADKLIYEIKTRQFRFEKGEEPVRVQWEEPQPAAGAAEQEGGK